MFTRYQYIGCLLLLYTALTASQSLKQLSDIDFEQADFYLLDVSENGSKVAPSIDTYLHQGDLYVAITPLFEGLRLQYSLIGETLSVTFANKTTEFLLNEEQSETGQWFNDGSFIFINTAILEQLFATQITINSNALKMSFSGHTDEFPYKTLKSQQKQRKLRNYVIDREDIDQESYSSSVITIKDEYRLATVPTGFASIEYQVNDKKERFDTNIQMESDLAYHSASITLNNSQKETNSRVLLSRYPQFPGDKILGIWDTYSIGDLYLRQSSLTSGSSRGLGINFAANVKGNFNENMTTSFSKTARPGWDADIYHNGVFLETRVVPADGLMEFTNLEVYYGANEFKIVLYGPYGEQETLIERIDVKSNNLGQGDISYGLSLKEDDSSLLDVDLSEFDIDAIGGRFSIGLFNNWQLGLSIDLNDINSPNGGSESYRISNQVTFPGWFFQNNTAFNSNDITQATSLATSFLNNDSFTLRYDSKWNKEATQKQLERSNFTVNYNLKLGKTLHNLGYENNELGSLRSEEIRYRFSFFNRYLNVSNLLNFTRRNGNEDRFVGTLNLTTRINNTLRFVTTMPYDIYGEKSFDTEQISASILYNYRAEGYNHTFNASNRSFFKENIWSIGYNLAVNKPTHQFTLRTQYNANEQWSLSAGISINFGYDYFNNEMIFSNKTLQNSGTLDVHAYLDRQLNGIPDVLDYDLAGVTFSGGPYWEDVETNQNGQARLFGAKNGVTALTANWESGSSTLNNDYIIYSHPGSLQRVNLPFYLTTEVELFVVIGNGGQAVTLANVPLIADNIATGDSYTIDTDFDGYASFVDLLPGKYTIYVDKKFLQEKGLQAKVAGFEITSPLKGGFVVLPNIELARSETGDIGENQIQKIVLDENNYEPLLNADNDKLIHLPPKGGMKAPYSSDKLDLAIFKEIKTQSTELERKELRRKLAEVAESANQPQPFNTKNTDNRSQDKVQTFDQIDKTLPPNTEAKERVMPQDVDEDVSFMQLEASTMVESQVDEENEKQPVQRVVNVKITPELKTNKKLDLTAGYVVQYASLSSLDIAKALTKNYPKTAKLYIARKIIEGDTYYSLISEVFADQKAASQYLKTTEKDGYIVAATNYIETIWSQ